MKWKVSDDALKESFKYKKEFRVQGLAAKLEDELLGGGFKAVAKNAARWAGKTAVEAEPVDNWAQKLNEYIKKAM